MTYSTNLATIINQVNDKLSTAQFDAMCRLQATSLMAVLKNRIHIEGKDSNGSQIGTYTPAYVKYARQKAGRGTDNKVIISLTRQLESGYELRQLSGGEIGWAIALRSNEDMQKARWCEETYQKQIFAPTAEERALCKQIADDFISKIIAE